MTTITTTQKQGITMIYRKDIKRCHLCHCVTESNGEMGYLSKCNHTYHIACLIDYACDNNMVCPECNEEFKDARLSLAVAYKTEDTQRFIRILSGAED